MLDNFIQLLKDQLNMNSLLCRIILISGAFLTIACQIISTFSDFFKMMSFAAKSDCSKAYTILEEFSLIIFLISNNINCFVVLGIIFTLAYESKAIKTTSQLYLDTYENKLFESGKTPSDFHISYEQDGTQKLQFNESLPL